jgi:hypothetical protein
MPDFYQILNREIGHKKEGSGLANNEKPQNKNFGAVDNYQPKTALKSIKKKSKKALPGKNKKHPANKESNPDSFLSFEPINPIWLSLREAAKLGGIEKKTVKRALRMGTIKYRVIENRYQVDLKSLFLFLFSKKKLWNKMNERGIGQYIEKWIS